MAGCCENLKGFNFIYTHPWVHGPDIITECYYDGDSHWFYVALCSSARNGNAIHRHHLGVNIFADPPAMHKHYRKGCLRMRVCIAFHSHCTNAAEAQQDRE